MAKISIVVAPDPILNLKSKEVLPGEMNEQMREFITDMVDAIYSENAVGFAAIQFGVPKRIIVLDLGNDDETPREPDFYPKILINPEFTYKSDTMVTAFEACMSVPNIKLDVPRSAEVEIRFKDVDFKEHTLKSGGWLARAIQHEMDHLDGVTLLDHMSSLKRDMSIRKLQKLKKSL
ncbi:MAG UNVERIFIED_CONTAM: peptide deformylase [Rickettsiaceae bacterium]|jgi:peptide deformylase